MKLNPPRGLLHHLQNGMAYLFLVLNLVILALTIKELFT